MSLVNKHFRIKDGIRTVAVDVNSRDPFNIEGGDSFEIIEELGKKYWNVEEYLAVYRGPGNPDAIGLNFEVGEGYLDKHCVPLSPNKASPELVCSCDILDMLHFGHMPECAFIRSGGCSAPRKVR